MARLRITNDFGFGFAIFWVRANIPPGACDSVFPAPAAPASDLVMDSILGHAPARLSNGTAMRPPADGRNSPDRS